jgi:hypothetical protein
MNIQGRADSFYPVDQRQEHNNTGIQVSSLFIFATCNNPLSELGPAGPNTTWEHHQKVAPVIPYYLYNIQHVEEQVSAFLFLSLWPLIYMILDYRTILVAYAQRSKMRKGH